MENKARRYSDEEKKQLLDRYQALLKEGKNVIGAAKELGVSYVTIRAWQKKDGKKPARQAALKAKKAASKRRAKPGMRARPRVARKARAAEKKTVRAERKAGRNLVVVMPNGYRIEGFTVDGLIKLLKAVK